MKIWPSGPLIFELSCISPMKDEICFYILKKKIKNKNGLKLSFIFVLF